MEPDLTGAALMFNRRILPAIVITMLIVGSFLGGYLLGQSEIAPMSLAGLTSGTPASARTAFEPFWEVWQILQDDYFDQPLDSTSLAEGAIDGMLSVLDDPNTRYLSPIEEEANRLNFEGEYEGIGAEVTIEDEAIVIVAPFEGSPAAAAGIRPGDIIRQVDGIDVSGMDLGEAASLVRGPAGSVISLVIDRDGTLIEMEVVRDSIDIPSVRGEILENNIAYIRISRFSTDTVDELERNIETVLLQDSAGMILDMRSNPGGSLSTAVDIADHFLDEGLILIERFGNGEEVPFNATYDGLAQDVPLVVLIDEGSASAPEVVAAAIKDRGRGTIIGTTSFGKGTVQTWHQLSNDGGFRVTVARWLSPDGTWIHGEGIIPDISIPTQEADGEIDNQLQAAISYLLGERIIGSGLENEQ